MVCADIDPKLHKALQLQQYSAQYLLSCHSLLRDKEKIVRTALRTFEDEERMLDLKIAKMRFAFLSQCLILNHEL
jgi:hypothetical protein